MDTLNWGEILIILIGLIIGIAFGRKGERKLTSGLFVPKHDSAGNDSKGENSLPVRIIKDMESNMNCWMTADVYSLTKVNTFILIMPVRIQGSSGLWI